jgi:DNA-binding transcriptional regulator YhcF (GntR family)
MELEINRQSHIPKYQQLVSAIVLAIERRELCQGDQLPSIQYLSKAYHLAPGTVTKAYETLKVRGIVRAMRGKGLYVQSEDVGQQHNVLIVFDELNAYKEVLYHSLKKHLGESSRFTTFFHHHNAKLFEQIISDNLGLYSHYIVMPHFDTPVPHIINTIPMTKLTLIDGAGEGVRQPHRAVYQNFRQGIMQALGSGHLLLKKYQRINLHLAKNSFQFVPASLIEGFRAFCIQHSMAYQIHETLREEQLSPGQVHIVFNDRDLITIVRWSRERGLRLGHDVGLISYDDTPMKEVLEGGITAISTDFEAMGATAARLITAKELARVEIVTRLIVRNTL